MKKQTTRKIVAKKQKKEGKIGGLTANINTDPLRIESIPESFLGLVENPFYDAENPEEFPEFIEQNILNYTSRTDLHHSHGWREVVMPEFNSETEKLGDLFFDLAEDVVTYEVLTKTQSEIESEAISEAKNQQEESLQNLMKKKLIDELQLEDDDSTIIENQHAYPIWEANGEPILAGTKVRHFKNDGAMTIYRCNQDILATTQFEPRIAVYAYDEIVMGGAYPIWVAPQAHNPYMSGDIVWFPTEGSQLYISNVDNNFHGPNVVPNAWSIYND